jgi:hypothetical protein
MLTLICCGLLFQQDRGRSLDHFLVVEAGKTHAVEQQQRRENIEEKRRFSEGFNNLVDALRRFADAYNGGQGEVWPVKEADALRKAYHELERNRLWTPPTGRKH